MALAVGFCTVAGGCTGPSGHTATAEVPQIDGAEQTDATPVTIIDQATMACISKALLPEWYMTQTNNVVVIARHNTSERAPVITLYFFEELSQQEWQQRNPQRRPSRYNGKYSLSVAHRHRGDVWIRLYREGEEVLDTILLELGMKRYDGLAGSENSSKAPDEASQE